MKVIMSRTWFQNMGIDYKIVKKKKKSVTIAKLGMETAQDGDCETVRTVK